MSESVWISEKKSKIAKEDRTSQTRKSNYSQPVNSSVDCILFLQRTIGNQAVGKLLKSGALQAKLSFGKPGDIYEQEVEPRMREGDHGFDSDAINSGDLGDTDPGHLRAKELAGDDFDAAYHNLPPLGLNDTRVRAVSVLQTILAERFRMREAMPQTFRSGQADGQWGPETTRSVRSFQETQGVRPVGGWEAGHKTLLALDRALTRAPVPPTRTPVIELRPLVGTEAGPSQWLGDVPYDITVMGHGFSGLTPLFISFEDDPPVDAVANANGEFRRTFAAARRVRGLYHVHTRSLTSEVTTEFRVVPADQPIPDPRREQRYAYFLREATRKLRDADFGAPLSPDFESDKFDTDFWQWEGDKKYSRALQLKHGKTPADAIDALFDRLTAWKIDCDYTVQIANLYAARMTYGAAMFNHRQGPLMLLRLRESSGLTTNLHYGRRGPLEPWRIVHNFIPPDSFVFAAGPPMQTKTKDIVAEAPSGSRVRWTNANSDVPAYSAFKHENTVKLGADLYAAAGIDDPLTGNEFTQDALELRLAIMATPRPTKADIQRMIYIDEVEVFDR